MAELLFNLTTPLTNQPNSYLGAYLGLNATVTIAFSTPFYLDEYGDYVNYGFPYPAGTATGSGSGATNRNANLSFSFSDPAGIETGFYGTPSTTIGISFGGTAYGQSWSVSFLGTPDPGGSSFTGRVIWTGFVLNANGTPDIVDGHETFIFQNVTIPFTGSLTPGGADGTFFTPNKDIIDFNNLQPDKMAALALDPNLGTPQSIEYFGLGGNDIVTLPSAANFNKSIGGGKSLGWTATPASTFSTNSVSGQNYTINGSDGNYFINMGAGTDTLNLTLTSQLVPTDVINGFIPGDRIDFLNMHGLTLSAAFSRSGGQDPGEVDVYSKQALVAILDFTGTNVDLLTNTLQPIVDASGTGTAIVIDSSAVPLMDPQGTSIRWSFIRGQEGNLLAPYVPKPNTTSSGLTVGVGVDLANGLIHQATITNAYGLTFPGFSSIFPDYASNPNLVFLYNATNNQTNAVKNTAPKGPNAVTYLINNGTEQVAGGNPTSTSVSITQSQANLLSNTAEQYQLNDLITVWSAYTSTSFTELPAQAQTVLLDYSYSHDVEAWPTRQGTPAQKLSQKLFFDIIQAGSTVTTSPPYGSAQAWAQVVLDLKLFGTDRQSAEAGLILEIPGVTSALLNILSIQPGTAVASNDWNYNFDDTSTSTIYALDPSGSTTYTLIENPGSPNFSTIQLPAGDADQYSVSYEIGKQWSTPQIAQPLDRLTLPSNVVGLRVALQYANGSSELSPDGYTFLVTFATLGTFSGTVHAANRLSDDFNGDGSSDILWRNASSGQIGYWNSNGSGGFTYKTINQGDLTWQILGSGDFNGDGSADILWRNTITGQVGPWDSNPSGGITPVLFNLGDLTWQVQGIGDFNGDGSSDILWRNMTNGQVGIWASNGSGGFTYQTINQGDLSWQIQGAGDFNGDGSADMLWRNTSTGQVGIWDSNGFGGFTYQTINQGDLTWQIQGVGDFNGDSQSDILWRNTSTGQVGIWDSNGSGGFTYQVINQGDLTWQIVGVGDFNGDGKADILWRNTVTGQVGPWNSNASGGFTPQVFNEGDLSWNTLNGNDTLVASTANSTLFGNPGNTTFAIGPSPGQDKIYNFATGQDTLQFNHALFANFAAAMTNATQVGANTVLSIDANDSVTLENVNKNSLTASNFRFS
jgi:hypothetical protein